MIKKRGKEIYQPPYAQDLSGFSANGQVQPTGICYDGGAPYTSCTIGEDVGLGSCTPTGSSPEASGCSVGVDVDTDPQCKVGSNALVGCKSGSHA